MEKLNATFEGEKMTLARVWEYLQATRSSNGLSIFVTKESGPVIPATSLTVARRSIPL